MANKLEVIVDPNKPTIETRRTFNAPRHLVWEAWTKPEHLKRWLGPDALEWVVLDMDFRVGGKYRWVQRAPDGNEYSFHGEYREIVKPTKIVQTFIFDGMPDAVAVDTLTLEEHDGKTTCITMTLHSSIENRDGHFANGGMEVGMREGYDRLEKILAEQLRRAS
jgi:uncharacterized protein YndB with AHSA1/START domain